VAKATLRLGHTVARLFQQQLLGLNIILHYVGDHAQL
jgi:hypothetical protein